MLISHSCQLYIATVYTGGACTNVPPISRRVAGSPAFAESRTVHQEGATKHKILRRYSFSLHDVRGRQRHEGCPPNVLGRYPTGRGGRLLCRADNSYWVKSCTVFRWKLSISSYSYGKKLHFNQRDGSCGVCTRVASHNYALACCNRVLWFSAAVLGRL